MFLIFDYHIDSLGQSGNRGFQVLILNKENDD